MGFAKNSIKLEVVEAFIKTSLDSDKTSIAVWTSGSKLTAVLFIPISQLKHENCEL